MKYVLQARAEVLARIHPAGRSVRFARQCRGYGRKDLSVGAGFNQRPQEFMSDSATHEEIVRQGLVAEPVHIDLTLGIARKRVVMPRAEE